MAANSDCLRGLWQRSQLAPFPPFLCLWHGYNVKYQGLYGRSDARGARDRGLTPGKARAKGLSRTARMSRADWAKATRSRLTAKERSELFVKYNYMCTNAIRVSVVIACPVSQIPTQKNSDKGSGHARAASGVGERT